MPLSRARDRLRKRLERGTVQLSPTEQFEALPQYRRKEVLAEIALHPTDAPVTAGHRIAAIKEINLMEHVYDEPAERGARVVNFVFVLPDGARLQPGDMVKQIEANNE